MGPLLQEGSARKWSPAEGQQRPLQALPHTLSLCSLPTIALTAGTGGAAAVELVWAWAVFHQGGGGKGRPACLRGIDINYRCDCFLCVTILPAFCTIKCGAKGGLHTHPSRCPSLWKLWSPSSLVAGTCAAIWRTKCSETS